MKLKHYLLAAFTCACSVTPLHANELKQTKQCIMEHDEDCEDEDCDEDYDEDDDVESVTAEEARAFIKENAPYALGDFEETVKEGGREAEWMLEEISSLMHEHAELKKYDPALAKLFVDVHKLEAELDQKMEIIEDKLDNGEAVDTDATAEALAPQIKQLMQQELKLEKGYIGFAKWKLDQELKELEADEAKLDDILKEELEELKKELKEAAEEDKD